eukprot:2047422-Pyramimonas_sp.AAC.1
MAMLLHLTPRMLKEGSACSLPIYAQRSLLAGSRHSNKLARTLIYRVVKAMNSQVKMVQPRTWFDDIGLRAVGSCAQVEDCIVTATLVLAKELNSEGLSMAGKPVLFSTDFGMTKRATKRLKCMGADIKGATEGRDLGLDRAGRT